MRTNIRADLTPQHPQLSDNQLLSQAKSGDQQAFGELCMRYYGMLKRKYSASSDTTANDFEALELPDLAPDPEQEYITDQTFLTLWKAIENLPSRARCVMDLCYRKECRISEAAVMLGITEATAKSRMLRAQRVLRLALMQQQNADAVNDKRLERPPRARQHCTSSQVRTALVHRTT